MQPIGTAAIDRQAPIKIQIPRGFPRGDSISASWNRHWWTEADSGPMQACRRFNRLPGNSSNVGVPILADLPRIGKSSRSACSVVSDSLVGIVSIWRLDATDHRPTRMLAVICRCGANRFAWKETAHHRDSSSTRRTSSNRFRISATPLRRRQPVGRSN